MLRRLTPKQPRGGSLPPPARRRRRTAPLQTLRPARRARHVIEAKGFDDPDRERSNEQPPGLTHRTGIPHRGPGIRLVRQPHRQQARQARRRDQPEPGATRHGTLLQVREQHPHQRHALRYLPPFGYHLSTEPFFVVLKEQRRRAVARWGWESGSPITHCLVMVFRPDFFGQPHTLPNTADRNMADVVGRVRTVLRQRREGASEQLPILSGPGREGSNNSSHERTVR